MANPIAFEPKPVDPKMELQRRLDAAPLEHAEALLAAYDLLEEAHNQGLLDLLHGAMGSKDAIMAKIAQYARQPVSTTAIRNLLALGELLGSIDPELLQPARPQQKPPSLWQIIRRMLSEDGRRGLGRLTALLTAMGSSDK